MKYSNRFLHRILTSLRYRLSPFFKQENVDTMNYIDNHIECNRDILYALESGKPFMVSRFGLVEIRAVVNAIWVSNNPHSFIKYITRRQEQWWWNQSFVDEMQTNAGFFPLTEENLLKFSQLVVDDAHYIDILGTDMESSLNYYQQYLKNELIDSKKYALGNIKPLYHDQYSEYCWLQGLKGKRVLIVHPFVDSIRKQYTQHRTKLFPNPDFLPEFTLLTIKAVQSLGGKCEFRTWFEALEWMKTEMDKIEYDVCILGCGAYGLSLAAHAKRTGHQAIHLGGGTQILFGIKGRRWDDSEYFKTLFNEYWTRPSDCETPQIAQKVEGGCYW